MQRRVAKRAPWAAAVALLVSAMGVAHHATATQPHAHPGTTDGIQPAAQPNSQPDAHSDAQPAAQPGHTPRLVVSIHPLSKRLRSHDKRQVRATVRWNGPPAKLSYHWSALSGTLPPGTVTSNKTLLLDAAQLTPGEEYFLELAVTATYALPPDKGPHRKDAPSDSDEAETEAEETDEIAAQATVSFSVNAPPEDGECNAAVSWQDKNRASIKVEADGWNDRNGDAMQYRYFLLKNGHRRLLQSWTTATEKTFTTRAASGDEVQIRCEVRDSLGESTSATSQLSERP